MMQLKLVEKQNMEFKDTTALRKILLMKKRLRIVQGGSSAGKTIAILLILINIAQSKHNKLISIVSESVPHLKRASIRDFINIMQAHGYYKDSLWNRTDYIYTFESGSKIEFFSADQSDKVRGPRRDILFINEANNVNYEVYTQLAIRTAEFIYLDYNPVSEFWVHNDILGLSNDYDFDILTYKDNEFLPFEVVKEIEARKNNKQFWQVYGLGELGVFEGRIYIDWQLLDELPIESRLVRYGLDFGYTNDPTASDGLYKWNDSFIIDETIHQKGLSNRQIADIFLNIPRSLIIADSAEPKSIDELSQYGLKIIGSNKGAGSVLQGIQFVQGQKIFITKRSINTLKEYRNYLWMTDKDDKTINEPSPIWNHHMDAIRYALESFKDKKPYEQPTSFGGVRPLYEELGIA